MNYHTFKENDMLNGDGLRSVLWVSGCEAKCKNCFNPETWPFESGQPFTEEVKEAFINSASPDYISGITIVGGEPLHERNINEVALLVDEFKKRFPNKTVWVYTGYTFEDILNESEKDSAYEEMRRVFVRLYVDVLVDGRYVDELKDDGAKWKGSKNQRVIDVQKTLVADGQIIQHE